MTGVEEEVGGSRSVRVRARVVGVLRSSILALASTEVDHRTSDWILSAHRIDHEVEERCGFLEEKRGCVEEVGA